MPAFDPTGDFSPIDAEIARLTTPPAVSTVEAPEAPVFDPTADFTAVPQPSAPAVGGPKFNPGSEFSKVFTPEDLKTKTVEELDKEPDFRPADFNHQFEDALNADPIAKQKLLDVYKLREATGRTTSDELKSIAPKTLVEAITAPVRLSGSAVSTILKAGFGFGKSVVKAAINASGAIGGTALAGVQYATGASPKTVNDTLSAAGSMGAEIGAAVESDAVSTFNLLRKGARDSLETAAKLDPTGFVRDMTGAKPTSELTNEEWAARLATDVSSKKAEAEASRGMGGAVKALGQSADDLRASGIEIRPEVVQEISSAVSLLNLVPFGAGAKVGLMTKTAGRYAVREIATAATPLQASRFITEVNRGAELLGKAAKGVGVGVEKAGDLVNGIALKLKGTATIVGGVAAGTGNIAGGAGIILAGKFAGTAATKVGRGIQLASNLVPGAVRVGADVGAEFVKGYGQGLLFTAPFMIGADAEEREALLGAAGLGGVARGGVRALGHGKIGARLVGEAIQEKNADIIFKEVNQAKPPIDPATPYGTDPRLDAESAANIAKLDADPVRARQARVDAMLKIFDAETAQREAEGRMSPRKFEQRAKERAERIAKIPEVVKVQQNLLGWAKNLFAGTGTEFHVVDDAGMMRQTGGQSGRGYTVRTGQTIAPDGTVKPLIRVFLNGDVESLPHEMLHALGEIDAPGYAEFRNEVNTTLTPDQRKSFETIYNTVHNGGLPEAQWKTRLTPEKVTNEIAGELFSRTVLGEDLSGVSPSLKKRAATFAAGLLEKVGIPLGKLTRAQAKDFVPKGTKIKAGFSTLGLRPGSEAQALGHNFVQGLLKQAAEGNLTVASEKSAITGGTLQPGQISRKPTKTGTPPTTPPAPAPAPAPAPGPRNIRTTPAAQGDFAAQRHQQTKIDEAKATAEKTGNPEVVKHVEEISKAVETGTPLEIEYQSVKNEGSAESPSGRGTRRTEQENAYIAEAMGALPADVRELAQKVIVPVRWETVAGKPQLLAMSLDKVIANIHKVAKEAAAHSAEAKIPYEIRQGTLTPEAWHEVVTDFQDYADNQANGYRGDGQKLNRPTEDIGVSIPAENPAHTPVVIPEAKANFLNLVQGLKLPFTARETKGAVPGNVKGQILAEINARTPQKPTVIRPGDIQKQTFKTSGRDIMEVNPLRNELAADGVPVNSLIEVTERLSTENIEKVTPRPDINLKAPVTDIIRGGFLPGGKEFFKENSVEDIGRAVLDGTPEDFQKFTTEIGGLTGGAYRLGQSLKDVADVAKLRRFEAEALEKYNAARASQDFDAMMPAAVQKQFFTEAIETATGSKPGKQETIARILGPDWKPPFPEAGQLLPKVDNPRAVQSAAIRNSETGEIFGGSTHGEAMRKAAVADGIPKGEFSLSASYANPNYEQGFVTQGGDFLTRSEARQRVEEIGQISKEKLPSATQFNNDKNLESVGFQAYRNFLPGEQTDAALRAGFLPDKKTPKQETDKGIADIATKVATAAGIDYNPSRVYASPDPALSNKLADFYDKAKSNPKDPEVAASYAALADETMKQYRAIVDAGYTLEPFIGEGEPYKNSAEAVADIRDNKHLFVLSTAPNFEGGNDNPMLLSSGVEGLPTVNDVFRGVHDIFGHAKEGYQFGPRGEFNAWRVHSEMYSPEAQGALAAETLAQNSWVNFGPHLRGKAEIPLPERPFAEQKAVVVPQELIDEARGVAGGQLLPKTEAGRKLADEGFDFRRAGGPANRSIVATRGGIFSGEIESTANNKGEAYIADVNVVKADREKGVGEALYRELLTDLKSDDIKTVRGMVVSPGPLNIRKKIFGGFSKLEVNGEPATIDEAIGHTKRIPGTRETIAVEAGNVITPESQFLPAPRVRRDEQGRPLTKDGLIDYERLYKETVAEERAQNTEPTDYSKYQTAGKSARSPEATGWILPNKTFVPLDVAFHENYLAENSAELNKKFGAKFGNKPDPEDRLMALNVGFVRIRGGLQGERRTSGPGGVVVELNGRYFRKFRPVLESYLLDRADSIDNLTVSLLNDKGGTIDNARATVHELDGAEKANALLAVLEDLRLRGPEGQALPGGEETLPGLNLPSEERAKQLRLRGLRGIVKITTPQAAQDFPLEPGDIVIKKKR